MSSQWYHFELFHCTNINSWNNSNGWTVQTNFTPRIFPWWNWEIKNCSLVSTWGLLGPTLWTGSETLTIFSSGDVQVGHEPKCTGKNDEYWEKRNPTGQDGKELWKSIEQLWYQRSYLSCTADLGQWTYSLWNVIYPWCRIPPKVKIGKNKKKTVKIIELN